MSSELVDLAATSVAAVEEAVRARIEAGGLVAYPTESFYGIAASPWSAAACGRLRDLKGERGDKPFPLVLASTAACLRVARDLPSAFHRLSAAFWPGPLTLVLRAADDLPDELTAATGTVGVRVSPHPVAALVARAAGGAATATSANRSGEPAPRMAATVHERLAGALDMVLDGGETAGGLPSTVLDLTAEPPRLIRVGAIATERLAVELGYAPAPASEAGA